VPGKEEHLVSYILQHPGGSTAKPDTLGSSQALGHGLPDLGGLSCAQYPLLLTWEAACRQGRRPRVKPGS
jgi:hypothetical protein